MAFIYNLSDTWNDAGVTFTGIGLNVTDSASNAASNLLNLQVGGVSRFSIDKAGRLNLVGQTFQEIAATNTFNFILTGTSASPRFTFVGSSADLGSGVSLQWKDNVASNAGTADLAILRDAANTLAQRRGTNAQTFRVYNTFTDASNYERGFMRWNSNVLEIGTEAAGTGTARNTKVISPSTTIEGTTLVDIKQGSNVVRNFAGAFYPDNTNIPLGTTSKRWGNLFQNGFHELIEQTAPAAPAANSVRIYAEDNGSGKTRLMALFATGVAQQIAIEP